MSLSISLSRIRVRLSRQSKGFWDGFYGGLWRSALFSTQVEGTFHEGTIPESASRMTMAEITATFGHGLRGLLPSFLGT
eukprot:5702117-Amphidinium_carterae.1